KRADVVVPVLVDLLKVKRAADLEARETRRRFVQTVMEALRRIGPPATAAVSALDAMTKDTNRHIRESALSALQIIAPAVANKAGLRCSDGRLGRHAPDRLPLSGTAAS